jgi:hypothetical protein
MGGPDRWNELDRDKAVAYDTLTREECPHCGTLREDWVDENGFPLEQPMWAAVARTCYGCEDLERIRSQVPDKLKGVHVFLIPFSDLDEDKDFEIYDPSQDPNERERMAEQAAAQHGGMAG